MTLFAHPLFLAALIPVLLVLLLILWAGAALKKRILNHLFSQEVYTKLTLHLHPISPWRNVCLLTSILLLFLALAGPQWGTEIIEAHGSFAQTIIAVDVSASMQARDLKPDRLDNAKIMLRMLISNLKEERIGLIAFTYQAYVQCPITTDQDALNYFITALQPDMLPVPGTSLSAPIHLAARILSKYPGKKALILLTDGEDHNAKELAQAKDTALKNGIRIIAIGIGTKEGSLIPDKIDRTGRVLEYKKDKSGNTVVSKLDDKSLLELAKDTGGIFISYTTPAQVAAQVENNIRELDKTTTRTARNLTYKNRYQIPLTGSLILLAIYLLWPIGRRKKSLTGLRK